MIFSAYVLSQLLALSQPSPKDVFAEAVEPSRKIERIASLPGYDESGKLGFMPGLIPVATGNILTSLIQSIQAFSVTIPVSATSQTATITATVLANSTVFYSGHNTQTTASTGGGPDVDGLRVEQTNTTTLTAFRNTASASFTGTISGFVVEWKSGVVKNVQSGTISITTGLTGTATITGVVTGNTFLSNLGFTVTESSTAYSNFWTRINQTSGTVITATRGASSSFVNTVGYSCTEFNSGILNSSTQETTITLTSPTNSAIATIAAITIAQAMPVWCGFSGNNGNNSAAERPEQLFSSTTGLTGQKTGTTYSVVISSSIVEFQSQHVVAHSNTSNATIFSGTSSYDDTFTPAVASLSKAILAYGGHSQFATANVRNDMNMPRATFSATNTVHWQVNTAPSGGDISVFAKVMEFV